MARWLRTMEDSRFAVPERFAPCPDRPAWICLDMPRPLPEQIDIPFSVPFTHRLRFTTDVLGDDLGVLLDLIEKSGDQIPRVQFWVDEYVAKADPTLVPRLQSLIQESGERFLAPGPIQICPAVNQSRTTFTPRSGCCRSSTPMTWIVAAMSS